MIFHALSFLDTLSKSRIININYHHVQNIWKTTEKTFMNHQITPNPWTSLFVFSGDIPQKRRLLFWPKKRGPSSTGPSWCRRPGPPPRRPPRRRSPASYPADAVELLTFWHRFPPFCLDTCAHAQSHTHRYIYIYLYIFVYIYIMIPIIAYCKLCKYIYVYTYIYIYICVYVCYMNNMDKNLLR